MSGRAVSLGGFRGRPLVLNFWAFWCDTWKTELPHLKELASRRAEMGFAIVAVSVDGTRVEDFHRYAPGGVPFPALFDVGGAVSRSYDVRHVPTVLVLGADGTVRYRHVGYPGTAVVLNELRRLSAPPQLPPASAARAAPAASGRRPG